VLHHGANEHQWLTLESDHGPLTDLPRDGNGKILQYFDKRETAFKALQKLALDRQWLKSLMFYLLCFKLFLDLKIVVSLSAFQ